MTYHALTIRTINGRTHWHKPKETLKDLVKHLNQYQRLHCDFLIYEDSDDELLFMNGRAVDLLFAIVKWDPKKDYLFLTTDEDGDEIINRASKI